MAHSGSVHAFRARPSRSMVVRHAERNHRPPRRVALALATRHHCWRAESSGVGRLNGAAQPLVAAVGSREKNCAVLGRSGECAVAERVKVPSTAHHRHRRPLDRLRKAHAVVGIRASIHAPNTASTTMAHTTIAATTSCFVRSAETIASAAHVINVWPRLHLTSSAALGAALAAAIHADTLPEGWFRRRAP
jgi:hypothetical protein